MSGTHAAWLAARTPPPPPELRTAIAAELAASTGEAALPAALAAAGIRALRDAVALGDARPAAFRLLLADALFTYAIEAAAELGPDALDAVLESWGPGALAPAVGGADLA